MKIYLETTLFHKKEIAIYNYTIYNYIQFVNRSLVSLAISNN